MSTEKGNVAENKIYNLRSKVKKFSSKEYDKKSWERIDKRH